MNNKYFKNSLLKKLVIIFLISFISKQGFSQNQPMYSQYMFNMMSANPAYAGSRGDMNKIRLPTSETSSKVQGFGSHENVIHGHWRKNLTLNYELKNKKLGIVGFGRIGTCEAEGSANFG